jgi:hypothetical protein
LYRQHHRSKHAAAVKHVHDEVKMLRDDGQADILLFMDSARMQALV